MPQSNLVEKDSSNILKDDFSRLEIDKPLHFLIDAKVDAVVN